MRDATGSRLYRAEKKPISGIMQQNVRTTDKKERKSRPHGVTNRIVYLAHRQPLGYNRGFTQPTVFE
jgi:hypothetical protein